MTPTDQIINSLETEPGKWIQDDHLLKHTDTGVAIWTSNLAYLDIQIYRPKRRASFIEKFRLQRAVNKWSRVKLKAFYGDT